MSKKEHKADPGGESLEDNAQAICNCLNYLERETHLLGIPEASQLIRLAAEAVAKKTGLDQEEEQELFKKCTAQKLQLLN